MLLTAICIRSKINNICKSLNIEENNFILVRGLTNY